MKFGINKILGLNIRIDCRILIPRKLVVIKLVRKNGRRHQPSHKEEIQCDFSCLETDHTLYWKSKDAECKKKAA
jgi:hypothetical protein